MAAVALAALATVAAAHASNRTATVRVHDPWVRWLPGTLPAGGYLTLVNDGDQPVSLVGASCPDYGTVSLHRSLNVGGTSRMVPVDHIAVAAHSSLEFAAQGYHLMLEQPSHPLKPGDHVAITLRFSGAPPQTVSFELRAPGASEPMPAMPGMAP
ncbi:MAG: copper chaperone PCu(A)C [Steroidobacteraceae bacterium]